MIAFVFDLETTGLPLRRKETTYRDLDVYDSARIVSIAWRMINTETNEELANNYYIIKPDAFVIPEDSIKIHGITNERALDEGFSLTHVIDKAYLKKYMKPYNIDVRAASLEQRVDKHLKLRFVHYDIVTGYSNPFFLDMSKSTVKDVLGFDELPADSEKKMYKKQSYSLLNSENVFAATKNDTEQVYDVTPPGVVNLLGVRYLTMRCPEIESHLLGSIGFGNADVGLGIFKIPSPYETANLKFDFFNFVKKPFHPIGKLTKLSIRFEREPNVLYDFRGLNHHILVTLKYYVPAMNNDLTNTTPILNPNYNPDFLKYIVEREEVLNDDEDDDDDYEDVTQESLLERYVYYKS
eukprot:gene9114-16236_t